jgi:NAD+--asparagine ADP-ribosyltransferase
MSKTPSDNLFRLVKSLTKPEKRYFKLYAMRHSAEENNYLRIFDVIDLQKKYDEAVVLKKFQKDAFAKKFPIAKSRLYETILRSLDAYHANSSIDAQLKKQLHCAEILYKKSLYSQCTKLLASARRMAVKHEKFPSLVEIFHWEKKLIEKDNYYREDEDSINNMQPLPSASVISMNTGI